jgi:hypothetical protein
MHQAVVDTDRVLRRPHAVAALKTDREAVGIQVVVRDVHTAANRIPCASDVNETEEVWLDRLIQRTSARAFRAHRVSHT